MNVGILYDAHNYTVTSIENDFSLLSEVTKIKQGLEEANHKVSLVENINEMVRIIVSSSEPPWDIIINHISWTRTLQKVSPLTFLDFYNIPYVGNCHKALMLCADKYISKLIAQDLNIPVPKFIFQSYPYKSLLNYSDIVATLGSPFVIKANGSSGSLGVKKICSCMEYESVCANFMKNWHSGILFEEFISGIDLTVPVLNNGKEYHALAAIQYLDGDKKEIPFFTREIKYFEDICCQVFQDEKIAALLKKYATKIHAALYCNIFSRSDFRLTDEGQIFFLECNATPDLNPSGAFVTAGDFTYSELLDHIIKLSFEQATKT